VFTGDTGRSEAVTDLAKNADVLVAEVSPPLEEVVAVFEKNGSWDAMTKEEQDTFVRHVREEHLTAEDLGRMAAKAGVRTVVMTHFGSTADPEHDYQRLAGAAAKYYSGRIVLAKDLMRF
jgi:ribonuclease BN (tRNA processing enzyme)